MAGSGLENSNSKSEQPALNEMDEFLEIIHDHLWSKPRFTLRTAVLLSITVKLRTSV